MKNDGAEDSSARCNPSQDQKKILEKVRVGDVFRMRLGPEEGVPGKNDGDGGRNKYFVIAGIDTKKEFLGILLINTDINRNIPVGRQKLHLKLFTDEYIFLRDKNPESPVESRFVDCSDMKKFRLAKFCKSCNRDKWKGRIETEDMNRILEETANSEFASPKWMKRFGLNRFIKSDPRGTDK